MYGSGDKAGAIEAFATEMGGDEFRAVFDRTMPPGYFERWVATADTLFQSEIPSLNMVGANTRAYFREIHDTIRTWLPHAENVELPDATHAAFQTNPIGSAERIAAFISRHRIEGY